MSMKLTRKLLKASEDDFQQLLEPKTVAKSGRLPPMEAATANGRKRKKPTSGAKSGAVEMSEDDILRWYVGGIVQADKILSSSSDAHPEKPQSKSIVAESLRLLERDNNTQTKQRKAQAILNKTKGSSRTAPVQKHPESSFNRHVPTFNKVRYERQKKQELHEKIANKLKALDKSKLLKSKKKGAEVAVK